MEENENKYGKYLPIGTVVMLRNGKKRVMINGFCPTANNNGETKSYDYCGVVYPEGVITMKETLLFDHSQISKIYHMGLANDEEEKAFKRKLKELVEKKNNE